MTGLNFFFFFQKHTESAVVLPFRKKGGGENLGGGDWERVSIDFVSLVSWCFKPSQLTGDCIRVRLRSMMTMIIVMIER